MPVRLLVQRSGVDAGRGMRNSDETLAETLSALAHATRLRLLALLAEKPATVSELRVRARLLQPTVSKHLRVLQDAGLVASGRNASDGRSRVYWVRPEPFKRLEQWAGELAQLRQSISAALVADDAHIPQGAKQVTSRGTERVRRRYFHRIEDEHEARDHHTDPEWQEQRLFKRIKRSAFESRLAEAAARRARSRAQRMQQYE